MTAPRLVRLLLLLLPAVAGCTLLGVEPIELTVENTSTIAVAIRVNGEVIGRVEPQTGAAMALPGGALPLEVEAVSPGGRVLGTLDIVARPTCAPLPDGGLDCSGYVSLHDMVCGRVAMWASGTVPSFPAPVPGEGAPCGP